MLRKGLGRDAVPELAPPELHSSGVCRRLKGACPSRRHALYRLVYTASMGPEGEDGEVPTPSLGIILRSSQRYANVPRSRVVMRK